MHLRMMFITAPEMGGPSWNGAEAGRLIPTPRRAVLRTGNPGWPDGNRLHITKFSQIINPSDKYVFVEEGTKYAGGHGGANLGPWALNPETKQWIDPVAVWHNDASTFSFADGHAESHRWLEVSTKKASGEQTQLMWSGPSNDRDLAWCLERYAWKGNSRP